MDRWKFKAIGVHDNEKHIGYLSCCPDGSVDRYNVPKEKGYYISNMTGNPWAFKVKEKTICQCTGRSDKLGILIFENDFVTPYPFKIPIYKVVYLGGSFVLADISTKESPRYRSLYDFNDHLLIIDDPETKQELKNAEIIISKEEIMDLIGYVPEITFKDVFCIEPKGNEPYVGFREFLFFVQAMSKRLLETGDRIPWFRTDEETLKSQLLSYLELGLFTTKDEAKKTNDLVSAAIACMMIWSKQL